MNRPIESDWHSDVIAACGYWEPLAFLRRRGTTTTDDEHRYRLAHTEAMARQIARLGINLAIWHGYKGLGVEHERPDMELTRQFGEHCRKHGIRLAAYCNLGTFFAETMFAENPAAEQWVAMDSFGQPQTYSELYRGYYRYRPCLTHHAFVDYVKQAAITLIRDIGARGIHFDNNAAIACYTERFLEHYRRHLREKFRTDTPEGLEQFRRRFGVDSPDRIVLPRGSYRMPIDTLPAAHEPNLQEWIGYRCELFTRMYAELVAAIKAHDPDVEVTNNPPMFGGLFVPMVWGVRLDDVSQYGDFMYAEDSLDAGVDEGSRLVGYFGNYKFGRAAGPRIMIHQSGSPLAMMEAAVLNRGTLGTLAHADSLPAPDSPMIRLLQFVRRHARWFTGTTTLADVAVLRGRDAMVNNWQQTWQTTLMCWQVLQRYGLQWDMLLEHDLSALRQYRLLILPNCISLGEATLERIRQYVSAGGRVLTIGASGQCDEWNRSRMGPVQGPEAEMDEGFSQFRPVSACPTTLFARTPVDASRIVRFPDLQSPQPFHWNPMQATVPLIGRAYWHFPVNGHELAKTIRRCLDDQPLVMFDEPSFVVPQLLRDADGLALHLLNYDAAGSQGAMRLRLNLPVRQADTFSLDDERMSAIEVRRDAEQSVLSIPPFSTWRALRLELVSDSTAPAPRQVPAMTPLGQGS